MGLNWAQWVLIGLCAFGAVYGVATIGKEREPRSPAEACIGLVLNGLMVWVIVEAGS